MQKTDRKPEVRVGEGVIIIKRPNRSALVMANVLAIETRDGLEHIYLDRIVHRPRETEFEGWLVSGAISTILSRPHSPPPSA